MNFRKVDINGNEIQENQLDNYKFVNIENGTMIYELKTEEDILSQLRNQREIECFPIINRGKLWYDNLTEQQIQELNQWYQDWLDVTDTKVIPEKPEWLD